MIKKIIFDAERMKYPHTGLFHFCHQLGLALKENAYINFTLYVLAFFGIIKGNDVS